MDLFQFALFYYALLYYIVALLTFLFQYPVNVLPVVVAPLVIIIFDMFHEEVLSKEMYLFFVTLTGLQICAVCYSILPEEEEEFN